MVKVTVVVVVLVVMMMVVVKVEGKWVVTDCGVSVW